MKGEFSRLTFDYRRHFAATLSQQGRVGSDADWNEWVEEVLYRFRKETLDVIGGCGRPEKHPGFTVSVNGSGTATPSVQLSKGRLYAGGLLAELENDVNFMAQYDWPLPSSATWNTLFPGVAYPGLDFTTLVKNENQEDLYYVEVWLRHVTALIDEAERQESIADAAPNSPNWNAVPEVGDYIRERALGGPDTCTRLQTVAQVKRWRVNDPAITTCEAACAALSKAVHFKTLGTLQVNLRPTPPITKPCDEPQIGGYGGAENRMYRVEVHDPGPAGTGTFKWSLENGAFHVPVINVNALTVVPAGTSISVQTNGNDQITRLKQNDWVEMCGEETELGMWRNSLAQLVSDPVGQPDGSWQLQLKGPASVIVPHAPFLRRWSGNTQTIVLNSRFNLDAGSGLSVTFFADTSGGVNPANTYFHEMDYWVWSARTLSRDIEPPCLANTPQEVRGIERHKCCLALVTWTTDGKGNFTAASIDQCPNLFPPLTDLPDEDGCCCCTITVGDGKTSKGQFSDLPSAFAALKPGSRICIRAGDYTVEKPIAILQDNVLVEGCGAQTRIHGPNGVFTVANHTNVGFRQLTLQVASAPAISVTSGSQIRIQSNHVLVNRDKVPTFAFTVQGTSISIVGNSIDGAAEGTSGGGIEVRGESADVNILENFISGGDPRGITLGSVVLPEIGKPVEILNPALDAAKVSAPAAPAVKAKAKKAAVAKAGELPQADVAEPYPSAGHLQNILIARNHILNTGLEAIGVPRLQPLTLAELTKVSRLLSIIGLTIIENFIQKCGTRRAVDNSTGHLMEAAPSAKGIISLEDVEFCEISRNLIEANGSLLFASGIYIVLAAGARIHDNKLLANGSTSLSSQFADAGAISLKWVVPPPTSAESDWPSYGWAAASVCDNLALALACPALRLTGAGPMIISRNRFTTEGLPEKAPKLGAGVVSIGNLGIDDEYAFFLGLQNMAGNAKVSSLTTLNIALLLMLLRAGGEILFAENQCLLDAKVERRFTTFPVLAFTLDDLGFSGNQLRVRTPAVPVFPLLVDTLLLGVSLRAEDNRFKETASALLISCYALGLQTIGLGNMATHCVFFTGLANNAATANLVSPIFQGACG